MIISPSSSSSSSSKACIIAYSCSSTLIDAKKSTFITSPFSPVSSMMEPISSQSCSCPHPLHLLSDIKKPPLFTQSFDWYINETIGHPYNFAV